jgi:hypothetical protein
MKRNLTTLLATASLMLAAVGCHHEGAYQPVNTTQYNLENQANFVLMDPGAQRSVTCSGIQQTPLPDGRLRIAANVRNRENRRLQVQIQCEFKDEQGFALDSTPWQTLILTENGQETATFDSMNSQAKKYTVRIREAR